MRSNDRAFSPREMKLAAWSLLVCTLVGAGGLFVKEVLLEPSLGVYGGAEWAATSLPGVLDARPIDASF